MKQLHTTVFISTVFILSVLDCNATDSRDSARNEVGADSSVRAQGVMFLELQRRAIQILRRSFVVGTVRVEDDGFRFIPAMESPDGFASQEDFEREFWYNRLFKELYIPFADLRSIKHNGRIRLKGMRMYMIRSRDHKSWHSVYQQIKQAMPPKVKREKSNNKFIELLRFPKDVTYMELYRRGSAHFMNKTLALGSVRVEEEGLRFIPMTQVPPGYTRQELFEAAYWYNPLLRDLYIPFSEIKSINRKMYFRMKDGRKYILFGRPKYWESTVEQIKAKLTE